MTINDARNAKNNPLAAFHYYWEDLLYLKESRRGKLTLHKNVPHHWEDTYIRSALVTEELDHDQYHTDNPRHVWVKELHRSGVTGKDVSATEVESWERWTLVGFTEDSTIDWDGFKFNPIECWRYARDHGFHTNEIAPVAPDSWFMAFDPYLSFEKSYERLREELDNTAYADGHHAGIAAAFARFPSHKNHKLREALFG